LHAIKDQLITKYGKIGRCNQQAIINGNPEDEVFDFTDKKGVQKQIKLSDLTKNIEDKE
jgi:hypothetical protein